MQMLCYTEVPLQSCGRMEAAEQTLPDFCTKRGQEGQPLHQQPLVHTQLPQPCNKCRPPTAFCEALRGPLQACSQGTFLPRSLGQDITSRPVLPIQRCRQVGFPQKGTYKPGFLHKRMDGV